MPQSHKTQQLVSQQLQVLHAGLACPSLFNLNNTTPSIFTPRGLLQNKARPLVSPQMLFETPSIPPLKSHLLICISRTWMTKSNHEITCHHMTEKSLRSKLLVAGHSGWRTGNCKAKHSTKGHSESPKQLSIQANGPPSDSHRALTLSKHSSSRRPISSDSTYLTLPFFHLLICLLFKFLNSALVLY